MATDRVTAVEQALDATLAELAAAPPRSGRLGDRDALHRGGVLTAEDARGVWRAMVTSRALDVAARRLKAAGAGYYTISSAGHEVNALLGHLLRADDPCLLHYRSGGLVVARTHRHAPDLDPVRDVLLGVVAAAEDPVSGGRHKVWGSRRLWIPPQTSTIASHLPKATGLAVAIDRAARLGLGLPVADDAVVACTFGDASANHATALAGITAARYARRRGLGAPVLFVCEDNGLGISVPTPSRWIAETFSGQRHLHYVRAEGELDEVADAVAAAITRCREDRAPVFLHLPTVRLWGHAGSDVEAGYRTLDEIRGDEARDPIAAAARLLVAAGVATGEELVATLAEVRAHVAAVEGEVAGAPTLASADDVVAPLAPHRVEEVRAEAARGAASLTPALRRDVHGRELPEDATLPARRTLAACVNAALRDVLAARPETLVFGEDVGRKGGVYGVTGGLQATFGPHRVFDTLLDETTILGLAQGAGLAGQLPIPEIQYLAYVHNALDQLRGEAASTAFFSAGAFRTPMVVRIASFAYQKGFGGHFHNDHAIGALRDIPGLAIAAPAVGDDAARMLRGAVAMAAADGRVVAFCEPIALYHERDLHEPGDEGWCRTYPAPTGDVLLPGEVGTHAPPQGGEDADVTVVTYANGVRMALRAARRLAEADDVRVRVVDLRWLAPLPLDAVREEAERTGRVLVADECRATAGGVADALVAGLVESGFTGRVGSVRSRDTFVPLGPAADLVLLSEDDVVAGVRRLLA
ncbi:MAG: thiamine pyrophosphate-dependent enzyme [Actinomycetes bacterium]